MIQNKVHALEVSILYPPKNEYVGTFCFLLLYIVELMHIKWADSYWCSFSEKF